MLIQSKLKREGGTIVVLGDTEYHFKDDGKGNHVCKVDDEAHIARFLSITEGYHEAGKKAGKQSPPAEENNDDEDALPEDPSTWTNKQANEWAKAQNLNPVNKPNLLDFAATKGIEVDENQSPANIIRAIAEGLVGAE